MAITFDDLPVASPKISLEHAVEVNEKILAQLEKHQVPAIGFVNESKINVPGEVNARLDILRLWVNQGLDLGNHTYSHKDYSSTSYEEYTQSISKGEVYTKSILQEKNRNIRFFRPPYLNTGNTAEDKRKLKLFLKEKGYVIAPATIENSDFIFNLIYLKAKVENDSSMMKRTIQNYLDFTSQRLQYYEDVTMEVKGSLSTAQIFLCHVNALNADCMDQLLGLFRSRGYAFISLDEALKDTAYSSPSAYAGNEGISWLLRGDIGNREEILGREPKVDDSIRQEYIEIGEKQFWVLLKARILGLNATFLFLGIAFLLVVLIFILKVKPFKRRLKAV